MEVTVSTTIFAFSRPKGRIPLFLSPGVSRDVLSRHFGWKNATLQVWPQKNKTQMLKKKGRGGRFVNNNLVGGFNPFEKY